MSLADNRVKAANEPWSQGRIAGPSVRGDLRRGDAGVHRAKAEDAG